VVEQGAAPQVAQAYEAAMREVGARDDLADIAG